MYLKVIGLAIGLLTMGFGTIYLVHIISFEFKRTWMKLTVAISLILVVLLVIAPAFTAFVYHL